MAYDGTLKFDTSMDASGFQKGADTMGSIVKGMAAFKLIEKGFQLVVGSIDRAVSRYDTLNRFPKVLENMGFGAEQSADATQKLADGVTGLPTSLDEIVASAQNLTVLTGNLEKSVDTTLALNNAFYASNASASDASRGLVQYTQMLSKGKVDIISWRTLQETMGFALRQTAESFGFAGDSAQLDLYGALRDGKITFKEFNERIIQLDKGVGGFADMAKKSTGGIGTAFTNMRTRIAAGVTAIIGSIDKGFSQTRFKSIENIITSTGNTIRSVLIGASGSFEVVARNIDVLIPLLVGMGTAVTAWKIGAAIKGVADGFKAMQATAKAANAIAIAVGATDTHNIAIKTALAFALQNETRAELVRTAAKTAGMTIDKKGNLITAAGTVATAAETKAVLGSAGAATAKGTIVSLLTGKISLATAAQWLWNAAVSANPVGLIVAGIVALIAIIAALIIAFTRGSEEYRKQKKEVEELTEAQKALSEAAEESAKEYEDTSKTMTANAKASKDLVGELKNLQANTEKTDASHREMRNTVAMLNSSVDGLNVAYDEESGAIRNINTGQEVSLSQLEQLVDARLELAEANAWAGRYNELINEQVRAQEELAVIEAKRWELLHSITVVGEDRKKLLAELDEAERGYLQTIDDNAARIEIINEKQENSNTEMAESIVSDYAKMENAITKNGETVYEIAERWGVSADEIIQTWDAMGGEFDDFVKEQEKALEEYKTAVKGHVDSTINSFKEIPKEYEMSGQEMINVLRANRERYNEWRVAMSEISGQVSAETLAELEKLGPGALSAINEMRANGGEGLKAFDEEINAITKDAMTHASQNMNDPAFVGAASEALNESAQMVSGNTELEIAVTQSVEDAKVSAESVNFSSLGSSITDGISGAIQNGSNKVTAAVESIGSVVITAMMQMKNKAVTSATQMMTSINSSITTKAGTIKSSIAGIGNGITTGINDAKTRAVNLISQMMTSINSKIQSGATTVKSTISSMGTDIESGLAKTKTQAGTTISQMMTTINMAVINGAITVKSSVTKMMTDVNTEIKSGTTTAKTYATQMMSDITTALKTGATNVKAQAALMMNGVNSAISGSTSRIKASATSVANSTADGFRPMIEGARNIANQMMSGISVAMSNNAQSLYTKANNIATNIASTMAKALDVHSPSRVMIKLFGNVMLGIYEGMDGMSGMLYRKAETIADGISERFEIDPEISLDFVEKMRAMADVGHIKSEVLDTRLVYAGSNGTNYSTQLIQNITTPKPLSPSEMTREGQDMLRRQQFQLP